MCATTVEGHVLIPVVESAVFSSWIESVNVESALVLARGFRLADAAGGLLVTCPGRKRREPAPWMPDSV